MRNDAPLNEKVGGVEATDGEGVRYRLEPGQSSESALTYFRVEPESGDIVLQGDLTNELYTEYRLAVTAYDLGTPSLQTTVELRVVVQQVVTLPPNTGVGGGGALDLGDDDGGHGQGGQECGQSVDGRT